MILRRVTDLTPGETVWDYVIQEYIVFNGMISPEESEDGITEGRFVIPNIPHCHRFMEHDDLVFPTEASYLDYTSEE